MSASETDLSTLRRLWRDRAGASLLEFGLAFPLLLLIGGYGIELANYFLYNQRISQYALDLADNASRVDQSSRLREYDINDALTGAYIDGLGIDLTKNGRVTLTAIDNVKQEAAGDTAQKKRVHWQRCIGAQHFDTTLLPKVDPQQGGAPTDVGADAPDGYGDDGSKVSAPIDGSTMFAEITYLYKPLFGPLFMSERPIRYTASFVVRDNRDFTQIYNTPEQPISKCTIYSDKPPAVNYAE